MSQEPLDFGRTYRVIDEHRAVYRATEDTKDAIGLIVAAGASGMEAPDLAKTFTPNGGRHLRLRTVMAIGAVAGTDARRAIITPIARLFGFSLVAAAQPLTAEQKLARMQALLVARFGAAGAELAAEFDR